MTRKPFLFSGSREVSMWCFEPRLIGEDGEDAAHLRKSQPLPPTLAHVDDWQAHAHANGRTFYYSKSLNKSVWTLPKGSAVRARALEGGDGKAAAQGPSVCRPPRHSHHRGGNLGRAD